MRSLLVTTDYPPARGGVARYYSSLVAHLPQGSVDVLVPQPGWVWPRWLPWLALVGRASRSVDVVWVGQLLPVGTVAWILRKFGGKPYVVSTHGMDIMLPLRGVWKRWLASRILKSAAALTANSNFTADRISSSYGIARERIAVVYPAPGELPAAPRAEAPDPTVLAVGRLVRRKGFDLLIAAMEKVWENVPQAKLEIIGDGPESAALHSAVASSSRPDQICLLGDVGDVQLSQAYGYAWVFALPARSEGADVEGFGMVCVEAAAHGVPVVATDVGGVPEAAAVDTDTNQLVPAEDVPALASAISRILSDGRYRRELSELSVRWAGKFTWDRSASVLAGLLKRVHESSR